MHLILLSLLLNLLTISGSSNSFHDKFYRKRLMHGMEQCQTKVLKNGFVIVPPHPLSELVLPVSKKFSVNVDGLTIPCRNASNTSDAWFFFSGEIKIKVLFHEPINSYEISPKSLPADVKVEGNSITISLDSPRKFIIHNINGDLESLAVIADAPPVNLPHLDSSNVVDIRNFISDEKIRKIESAQIHEELVELDLRNEFSQAVASIKEGEILAIPAGVYPISTITLKSNMEFYMYPGSILYAVCGTRQIEGKDMAMVNARDADNTAIRGHGTILANGHIYSGGGDRGIRRQFPTSFEGGNNRIFSDFMIREQQHFSMQAKCTNSIVRNIKIITSIDGMNRDGLGVSRAKNLIIEDIFVFSGDDAIVVNLPKEMTDYDYNLLARNSVLWNQNSGGGIKIGYFWSTGVHNLVFENIDIISAPRSFSFLFQNNEHDVSQVVYKNIRCEKNRAKPGAKELLMDLYMGAVKKVEFVNLQVMHNSPFDITTNRTIDINFNGFYRFPNGPNKPAQLVNYLEPGMPATGITFKNESYTVLGIKSLVHSVNKPGKYKTFKVYRKGDISSPLTVPYKIYTNAIAGSHFKELSGNVHFTSGQAEAFIDVEFLSNGFKNGLSSILLVPDHISDIRVMMGPDFHACVSIIGR